MTDYTGTVVRAGRPGEVGVLTLARGYYDLTGAITGHASTGDTITWTNFFADGPCAFIVRDFWIDCPELDTSASPTGTLQAGNSDDDNGYVVTQGLAVGLQNSLAQNLRIGPRVSSGSLFDTQLTNRDLIVHFNTALATSATSGRINVNAWVEGAY